MSILKRIKTNYPGVVYINGTSINGKPERIFYIRYRKAGNLIEEKAGRQYRDAMTPSRAAQIRGDRILGKQLSNAERRKKIEEEKKGKAARWTVKKLWENYKENNPIKGIITDENRFELHIEPIIGDKEPHDLASFDIDRLRLKVQKNHKPATVKNTLELLRRIISYGVKRHLIPALPFKIQLPRVNNLKTEDLTQEQIKALLKAIDEDIHPVAGPMMKMALFTGMRRGEMFSLRWSEIDFQRGFIHLKNPKGGIDQVIPLNAEARKTLEALPRDSEYCFPGRGGEKRSDINKAVNEIKNRAGLPKDFRPLHGLRHVYGSMLASSGQVDLYTLQKLLTHKSPLMTQRYAHLRDETLKKASNLAGEIVSAITQEKKSDVVNIRK